jgi:FAD/FMN-containing dehydrogenase
MEPASGRQGASGAAARPKDQPAASPDGAGEVNAAYLEDASGYKGRAERVIIPGDEAGVAGAIREAVCGGIPVTIAGAGTGITGARVPDGGWVVSLERFRRLDVEQGKAIVGPGVLLGDLHAAAARTGQFYPPDPTETAASIGGTISTNASGSRSFRFGSTRRWVEALRVVLADGSVREFRRGQAIDFEVPAIPQPDTTKNTAGYALKPGMDWVDLFVGAEGTLGVVTEAEVRLLPAPKALLGGVVFFTGDDQAIDAVEAWRPAGPRMLEYFNRSSLEVMRPRYPEIPAAAGAAVLFEQDLESEDDPAVDAWLERLEAAGALVEESWFALSATDRERFRRFRHGLPELVNDTVRKRGFLKMASDYAVPLERNREMLAYYTEQLERRFRGSYVLFGHIGDAHVHVNILPETAAQAKAAPELMLDFARKAVELGGTVSAEHGLGKRKAHMLVLQYAAEHLEAMKAVKRRLDPQWLLGRGTLWPV